MDTEDKKALRVVLVVAAGFLAGLGYLLYMLATDL